MFNTLGYSPRERHLPTLNLNYSHRFTPFSPFWDLPNLDTGPPNEVFYAQKV